MMKKSYIFCALILSNLLGQSYTGLVKDISGEPIPYVFIEEINPDIDEINWVMTDFNGVFTIKASNTAQLSFERIGFKKTSLAINEIKGKSIVLLDEDIKLEAVEVYGSNNDKYLKYKTSANNLGSYSRGGSLNQIPSLELRTYGGYAGVTSASFEGGFARHTKVLFNGVDLTDAMNGQVDLSTLPSFALKSVNYRQNSGTKYGSGSIDGSLNINNNVTENNVFFSFGDFGFSQYGANYSINRSTSKRNIMFGKTSYDGDYKFNDSITGQRIVRLNNYLDQFFLAVDRQFIVRDDFIVNMFTLKTENTRGVAGSTSFQSESATRIDDFELFALSFNKFFKKGSVNISMNRSDNNQVYDDSNGSFPTLSEHDLEYSSFKVDGKHSISPSLNYEASFTQKTERVDSSDLNRHELKTTSYTLSGNYVNIEKDYKFSPSIRFDSREENKKSTFNLGFEALNQFDSSKSSFDFNLDVGSSFQFPTMNDLFWPDGQFSGGNKELKPEESQYFAFSMSNQSFLGRIKLTASIKDYKDLILWQPNEDFKYVPINVSSAERTSYNIQYLKEFSNLQMQLSYNVYESLDKDIDEKLLYTPDNSASLLMVYKQNNSTHYSLNYKLTGNRILQYESSFAEQIDDESYGLLSFGVSNLLNLQGGNIVVFNLTVDNLLDEEYISTIGYPEPGTSVIFTLEYKI